MDEALAGLGDVRHAVAGAVAANTYMPPGRPRTSTRPSRLARPARRRGRAPSGWLARQGTLRLGGGLAGSAGAGPERELDLLACPVAGAVQEAIAPAQDNVVDGRPTFTLEHLVVAKLIAGRAVDVADLSRMLGPPARRLGRRPRSRSRRPVRRPRQPGAARLVLGKLEYGPSRGLSKL